MTTKQAALDDQETMLTAHLDMRQHLETLKGVDPEIAGRVKASWDTFVLASQRVSIRQMAARLIMGGAYDKQADAIVAEQGTKSLVAALVGDRPMSAPVKRAMDTLGL